MPEIKMYRAEAILSVLIGMAIALATCLATAKGMHVDLGSFAMLFFTTVAMLLVAAFYRISGRGPRIALAVGGGAIFILFSASGAALNYVLLPASQPIVDGALFRIDAAMGFNWSSFARTVADYPELSRLLGYTYKSSLAQLAFLILFLGFTGRQVALHRFLIVGALASCLSILIWTLMPSFGPSAYIQLDPAVDARLGRVVGQEFGGWLLDVARHQPVVLNANQMTGLIAFPSMHTVMMLMCVWFARRTPAFWPCVAVNMLMIPAILVHGGHHLVDVIGGIVVFGAVAWLAHQVIPANEGIEAKELLPSADFGDRPLEAPGSLGTTIGLGASQAEA